MKRFVASMLAVLVGITAVQAQSRLEHLTVKSKILGTK